MAKKKVVKVKEPEMVECPICEGSGESECDACGNMTTCPECFGAGKVDKDLD